MPATRPRTGPHLAGLLVALAVGTAPLAGFATVAEQAAEIEQRQGSGDFAGAMAAARSLLAGLWEASPGIDFTEVVPETERSAGFGLYNPRPDTRYGQGEPVMIYVEPVGFGYGAGGEGIYLVGFYVDLQVLGADGNELANAVNITQLDHATRARVQEFGTDVIYNFDGLKPGKYRLVTTLRDKNSAKTGSFDLDIEVTDQVWSAPPPEGAPATGEGN
jgi:hypothetical protein